MNRMPVLMLVGPSQIGKDSLISRLCREHSYAYHKNATTRSPRPGDRELEEYEFLPRDEFRWRVMTQTFLDWDYYAGNYYGVVRSTAGGRLSVMHCGARMSVRIMGRSSDYLAVFLRPTDLASHRQRIHGSFSAPEAEARIGMMQEELDHLPFFDAVVDVASWASSDDVVKQVMRIHKESSRDV